MFGTLLRRTTRLHGQQVATAGVMAVAATHVLYSNNTLAHTEPPKPEDCEEVVCSSKKSALMSSFTKHKANAPKTTTQTRNVTSSASPLDQGTSQPDERECPVDREELGRSTWKLLHTVAAYYPESPNAEQQQAAKDMISSLAVLYPCTHCREHFAKGLVTHPPDVSSKEAFNLWLCERHNVVNKWIGKEEFPCTMEALKVRWRTGAPECFEQDDETSEESLVG